eukprot:GHVR01010327.1.p1 GENE.GHVR01010327.1~~GHVR01010327.1.p1  ORF type:complete len:476 (+),score=187.15 GHVR01010327.1:882-2309(+)
MSLSSNFIENTTTLLTQILSFMEYLFSSDDVQRRLDLCDEYLREFSQHDTHTHTHTHKEIQTQPILSCPLPSLRLPYPSHTHTHPSHTHTHTQEGGEETGDIVQVNWVLDGGTLLGWECLALRAMGGLLVNSHAAKLRRMLMTSGVGKSVIGGLTCDLVQNMFSVGLKGVQNSPDSGSIVEQLIMGYLKEIVANGFSSEMVAGALNALEFDLREFTTGGYSKGVVIGLAASKALTYGRDVADAFRYEDDMNTLRQKLRSEERLFENLVERFLLTNTHRVTVSLYPDHLYEERRCRSEREKLARHRDNMSMDEFEKVVNEYDTLNKLKLTPDSEASLTCLPSLSLEELHTHTHTHTQETPIEVYDDCEGALVLTHELPTSGILYVDVGIDLSSFTLEEIKMLPLLSSLISAGGTDVTPLDELMSRIDTHTGGIYTSVDVRHAPTHTHTHTLTQRFACNISQRSDRTVPNTWQMYTK